MLYLSHSLCLYYQFLCWKLTFYQFLTQGLPPLHIPLAQNSFSFGSVISQTCGGLTRAIRYCRMSWVWPEWLKGHLQSNTWLCPEGDWHSLQSAGYFSVGSTSIRQCYGNRVLFLECFSNFQNVYCGILLIIFI